VVDAHPGELRDLLAGRPVTRRRPPKSGRATSSRCRRERRVRRNSPRLMAVLIRRLFPVVMGGCLALSGQAATAHCQEAWMAVTRPPSTAMSRAAHWPEVRSSTCVQHRSAGGRPHGAASASGWTCYRENEKYRVRP
jgi:hypothetical protein